MAAGSGKAVLLHIKDDAGTPTFQAVGGLRSRSIKFNSQAIDITNADSTNSYRELLDQAGIRSASISGSGVFVDDVAIDEVQDAFAKNSIRDWKILIPHYYTISGKFKITDFELGAEYNGEITFSISLESAGDITMTTDA